MDAERLRRLPFLMPLVLTALAMGKVYKFQRPKGRKRAPPYRAKSRRSLWQWGPQQAMVAAMGVSLVGAIAINSDWSSSEAVPVAAMQAPQTVANTLTTAEALDAQQPEIGDEMDAQGEAVETAGTFACPSPDVTDGDTLRCGSRRVRLAGIDAPEMPGHCRPGRDCAPGDPYASTDNLRRLIGWSTLQCRQTDVDHYGRTVARCSAGGLDLSCGQLRDGQAMRRYAPISC